VLADGPVLYLTMDSGAARLPNGDPAAEFDGRGQALTVRSAPELSIPTARALTIEAWVRPSALRFPRAEAEGYVYILGKGDAARGYEYAFRMYSLENSAGRPSRISFYVWNPAGGLGSGAYFQDSVAASDWIMLAAVVDQDAGWISIYKNGVRRGSAPLSQYAVTPAATQAPFKVGTRNGTSWFAGAIGKVAVFPRALDSATLARHYAAMRWTLHPGHGGRAGAVLD
jgi:hypothetical protein